MKVLTKSEATKLAAGKAAIRTKFCTGKYKETIFGREVLDLKGVISVYGEKRKDRDGPYVALWCFSKLEEI